MTLMSDHSTQMDAEKEKKHELRKCETELGARYSRKRLRLKERRLWIGRSIWERKDDTA